MNKHYEDGPKQYVVAKQTMSWSEGKPIKLVWRLYDLKKNITKICRKNILSPLTASGSSNIKTCTVPCFSTTWFKLLSNKSVSESLLIQWGCLKYPNPTLTLLFFRCSLKLTKVIIFVYLAGMWNLTFLQLYFCVVISIYNPRNISQGPHMLKYETETFLLQTNPLDTHTMYLVSKFGLLRVHMCQHFMVCSPFVLYAM